MKKIKILSAIATVGMTSGVLLPLVTSCNVATGTIKLKLSEGVTAQPVTFKVGDKVIIEYKVSNENTVVTDEGIIVKFDGWKVQPSKKTWMHNRTKNTIVIFSAPTTDISIKISGYTTTPEVQPYISLQNGIGYTVVSTITSTPVSSISVSEGATWGEVLYGYGPDLEDGYIWDSGAWQYQDPDAPGQWLTVHVENEVVIGAIVRPIVVEADEPTSEVEDVITVGVLPDVYGGYVLGQLSDGQLSYYPESDTRTLKDIENDWTTSNKIQPFVGCHFSGWCDDSRGLIPDDVPLSELDFSYGLNITFKIDKDQENTIYMTLDSNNNFCYEFEDSYEAGTVLTLIADSRLLSSSKLLTYAVKSFHAQNNGGEIIRHAFTSDGISLEGTYGCKDSITVQLGDDVVDSTKCSYWQLCTLKMISDGGYSEYKRIPVTSLSGLGIVVCKATLAKQLNAGDKIIFTTTPAIVEEESEEGE